MGEIYGHITIGGGNGGAYCGHCKKNTYSLRTDDCNFKNSNCSIFIPV